jgi:uncharacterized protein YjdB
MRLSPATRLIRAFACAIGVLGIVASSALLVSCGARNPRLTQVMIAPANPHLAKGKTLQLSVTGVFDNGNQEAITPVVWQTSQSDMVTVSPQGEVTGVGEGVAQVSADYHGVTGNTSVTVGPPALVSIAVTPNPSSLPVGEYEQLAATGTYTDGSTQNLTQSATWSSSAATASVSPAGATLATAVGTATISATSGTVTGTASLTVMPAVLLGLNIVPATLSLPLGSSSQFQAIATLSDGTQQNVSSTVTWQTSQSGVATVNAQGYATATGKGVAQLSASYQGMAGNASITVGAPALVRITVSPNQVSLPVGETGQFTATGTYTDGSTQNLTQSVTWSSSASIASVSPAGTALAKAVGTATISATSGTLAGTASLAVTSAVAVSLSVAPATLSLPLGTGSQLQAIATMSDGTTQNPTTVTWSSAQSSVAAVNAQGYVTAAGKGTAQVSAAYNGLTGSAAIAVGPPALVSIKVSPTPSSLPLGETQQFTATGNYTDGSTQNLTQSAAWISSGPAIATVSPAGAAVAKAVGTATISATSGSLTGSASLTVSAAVVTALNIAPATLSMLLGSSSQLQATATMSDGTSQNLTGTVTWSSMQPGIAIVNASGMITAEMVGSTTILAQSSGFTASADITVMPLITAQYFNRANAQNSGYDSTIELTNPGLTAAGNLCAMIYVFDSKQELNECCGCMISDSGLRTLSLLNDLTANPLTGIQPVAGTIEIVSSDPAQNPKCDAGSLAPAGEVIAWGTNVQVSSGQYFVTEEKFATSDLNGTQSAVLATECSMLEKLGSGQGVCTCGTGD